MRRKLTDLDPYLAPPWRDPPEPPEEPEECPKCDGLHCDPGHWCDCRCVECDPDYHRDLRDER